MTLQAVQLDTDGYCYEFTSEGLRMWVNHHLYPSAGVYCADCASELTDRLEVKQYCKACALELNPQDLPLSEKGERFRAALEQWLILHSSLNVLNAAMLSYEVQEVLTRTSWEAHEHYAAKKGWRG